MKITTSYAIELRTRIKQRKPLFSVMHIYREAVDYCLPKFNDNWNDIKDKKLVYQQGICDKLIHNTKDNVAKYDFDSKFPKLPSYLRRDVINKTLGNVKSYHSNLERDENTRLASELHTFPTFFRGNMYKEDDKVYLKVFKDND